jgi:hypothetical protein
VASAPSPVRNRARVVGSGTLAVAVKLTPPAGQLPNVIEKLWPAGIPAKPAPIPVNRIVVTPPVVVTLQFMKVCGALQLIADAGTPDSINLRLCHDDSEALVNIRVPEPPAGEVNVKCVPTLVQPDPQTGSLMMILGSGTELANAAMQETIVIKINSAAMRFMETLSIEKRTIAQIATGKQNLAEASIYLGSGKSRAKTTTGADFTVWQSEVASFCGNPAEKCEQAAVFCTSPDNLHIPV